MTANTTGLGTTTSLIKSVEAGITLTTLRSAIVAGLTVSVRVPVKRGTPSCKLGGTGGHVEHVPGKLGNPTVNHIHGALSSTVNAVTVTLVAGHGIESSGVSPLLA